MDEKFSPPSANEPGPAERGPMARRGRAVSWWDVVHSTRAAKFARLTTFLSVVAIGVSWLAYSRTAAQMGDDLLDAGDALLRFADPEREEGPRLFNINGESIHATTGSTERAVTELLDWYEGVCLERDGEFTEQAREIAEANPEFARERGLLDVSPVLRREVGEEAGVVACLDLGAERRSGTEILEAYDRYVASRDLHELGDIRYLYARRTRSGRTQFISVWTDGSFNVERALPDEGDAPGEDIASVPRAPGSRRVLAAYEVGRDDRYYHYAGSSLTEWELEEFFSRELAASGWDVVRDLDGDGEEQAHVLAMRDGRQLYVMLDTDPRGRGSASVMLTE